MSTLQGVDIINTIRFEKPDGTLYLNSEISNIEAKISLLNDESTILAEMSYPKADPKIEIKTTGTTDFYYVIPYSITKNAYLSNYILECKYKVSGYWGGESANYDIFKKSTIQQ